MPWWLVLCSYQCETYPYCCVKIVFYCTVAVLLQLLDTWASGVGFYTLFIMDFFPCINFSFIQMAAHLFHTLLKSPSFSHWPPVLPSKCLLSSHSVPLVYTSIHVPITVLTHYWPREFFSETNTHDWQFFFWLAKNSVVSLTFCRLPDTSLVFWFLWNVFKPVFCRSKEAFSRIVSFLFLSVSESITKVFCWYNIHCLNQNYILKNYHLLGH